MPGFFLFGVPAAIIAKMKGFKSLRWLFALGFVGFIFVLTLKSAKVEGISPEEAADRIEKANSFGLWLCGINLGFSILLGLFSNS